MKRRRLLIDRYLFTRRPISLPSALFIRRSIITTPAAFLVFLPGQRELHRKLRVRGNEVRKIHDIHTELHPLTDVNIREIRTGALSEWRFLITLTYIILLTADYLIVARRRRCFWLHVITKDSHPPGESRGIRSGCQSTKTNFSLPLVAARN